MKRIYKKPETTVVAVEPVKMISQSSGTPNPPVKPGTPTDDPPLMLNHTTIPSNTEY